MEKIFTLLFIALFTLQMQGQNHTTPKSEPGKMYATCMHTSHIQHEDKQVLKVIFPQWKESTDTIFRTSENVKRVVVKTAATHWRFVLLDRNCLSTAPSNCVSLYCDEIPPQTQVIHFEENDSFKIVEVERLARIASLEWTHIDSTPSINNFTEVKPDKSSEYRYFKDKGNQIVYIHSKSNNWGVWRDVICSGGGYPPNFMANLQQLLKQKGYYSGEITNVINNETKMALIKFQKENQLPVGLLDFETLGALGVISESDKIFQELNKW